MSAPTPSPIPQVGTLCPSQRKILADYTRQEKLDLLIDLGGKWPEAGKGVTECQFAPLADEVVSLIDNIVANPKLKEAATKTFIRYIWLLVDKKEYDYALIILDALEGHPTGNSPKELAAKRVAGSLSYIEGILKKKPLYFTKGEFENMRAQVYMGVADHAKDLKDLYKAHNYYGKAWTLFKSAFNTGEIKYHDYKNDAKTGIISCQIGLFETNITGAVTLDELTSLDLKLVPASKLPDFQKRILLAAADAYTRSKEFAKAEDIYAAMIGEKVLPIPLQLFRITISINSTEIKNKRLWNLLEWSKATNSADKLNEALALANILPADKQKEFYAAAADIYYKAGDLDNALKISQKYKLNDIIGEIAWDLVKSGDEAKIEKAFLLADKIPPAQKTDFYSAGVDYFLKAKKMDKALALAIKFSLIDTAITCLVNKYKGEKDAAEKSKYKKAIIASLKIMVSGYDSIRSNPEWLQYLQALAAVNIPAESIKPNKALDKRLWLAGELESLEEKELSIKEYKAAEEPARKSGDALYLAKTLAGIGSLSSESTTSEKYFEEAGYIYNRLLGEKFNVEFNPKTQPTANISPLRPGSIEYLEALQKYAEIVSAKTPDNTALINRLLAEVEQLGGKVSASSRAQRLIETGRPNEAIDILIPNLNLSRQTNGIRTFSGNVGLLVWAYELIARKSKDSAYFAKAAAIYNALLYGTVASADGTNEIIQFISDNREKIKTFQKKDLSDASLHLKLARLYKDSGEIGQAQAEYDKALKTLPKDSQERPLIKLELTGIAAFKAKQLIMENKPGEALRLINTHNLDDIKPEIDRLSRTVKPIDRFRALSVLAWLYNMRGTITQDINDYKKAIEIYTKLLSDASYDDSIFTEAETSKVEIRLSLAGLFQSSAETDSSFNVKALEAFEAALKEPNISEEAKMTALTGKAEIFLAAAKLNLEAENIANSNIVADEALGILLSVFEKLKSTNLTPSELSLRATNALIWAFSLKIDLKKKADASQTIPEQAQLFILLNALITGKKSELFSDVRNANVNTLEAFMIKVKLGPAEKYKFAGNFIRTADELGQVKEALIEYYNIASLPDPADPKEKLDLANLHALVGDIHCFKLGSLYSFGEAKMLYDKALIILSSELARKANINSTSKLTGPNNEKEARKLMENESIKKTLLEPENIALQELYLRLLNGYGRLYIENNEAQKAVDEYHKITDFQLNQATNKPVPISLFENKINAYLSIGDAYNYEPGFSNNSRNALEAYKKAAALIRYTSGESMQRRMLAQACMGVGDIFRLREQNYKDAVRFYDIGIKLLEGQTLNRLGIKALAQLYAAKATDLVFLDKYEESTKFINLAEKTITSIPDDKYDNDHALIKRRIFEAKPAIRDKKDSLLSSASFSVVHVAETYMGQKSDDTDLKPAVDMSISLSNRTKLIFSYKEGLGRNYTFNVPSIIGELKRLHVDPMQSYSLGLLINDERKDINLRYGLLLGLNTASCSVTGYDWNKAITNYHRTHYTNGEFSSITVSGIFGIDYLKRVFAKRYFVSSGAEVQGTVMPQAGNPPLLAAEAQSMREFDGQLPGTTRPLIGRERYSAFVRQYLGLSGTVFPSGIPTIVGIRGTAEASYNPIVVSSEGYYPVDKDPGDLLFGYYSKKFMSLNASIGVNLEMFIRPEQIWEYLEFLNHLSPEWRIFASAVLQNSFWGRKFTNFSADAGLIINPFEKSYIKLLFGMSDYDDNKSSTRAKWLKLEVGY